uniref:C2H2-type domain-containing protein n=1 Tax=Heterorhabditis bacteriophora TaxID=37862 RepID=A0A1I7WR78_HETBA
MTELAAAEKQQSRTRLPNVCITGNESMHNCIECGDAVTIRDNVPLQPGNAFEEHLAVRHSDDCVGYKCDECGYQNAEQWKVRWHISVRHAAMAAEVNVSQLPSGSNNTLFITKYFPTAQGTVIDPEEEELLAELRGGRSSSKSGEEDNGSVEQKDSEQIELPPTAYRILRGCSPENSISCDLCNKVLEFNNKGSLCSLMSHAKRHYHIKQFECAHCSYASSEAAHVRTHLLVKHNSHERPIDHNNEQMQAAWVQVMKKCFPELAKRIEHFKFKSGKQFVDAEEEVYAPPVKRSRVYATRRMTEVKPEE